MAVAEGGVVVAISYNNTTVKFAALTPPFVNDFSAACDDAW